MTFKKVLAAALAGLALSVHDRTRYPNLDYTSHCWWLNDRLTVLKIIEYRRITNCGHPADNGVKLKRVAGSDFGVSYP